MGSFTQLAALALSLLAFHVSPSASAPAIPRGATSTDGSGDDTHALLSYPIIIPSPSLWEPFESFMASHVGLTAAYVFNETAQQEHLDLERRQREQKNELLGLSPPQHGTNISKRWGLECLSVNRAPSVGARACRLLLSCRPSGSSRATFPRPSQARGPRRSALRSTTGAAGRTCSSSREDPQLRRRVLQARTRGTF